MNVGTHHSGGAKVYWILEEKVASIKSKELRYQSGPRAGNRVSGKLEGVRGSRSPEFNETPRANEGEDFNSFSRGNNKRPPQCGPPNEPL